MMSRERAFALLGLLPSPHVEAGTIKRAAATAIMRLHPDTASDAAPYGVTIAQIQEARDFLVSQQYGSPCVMCKGRGKVFVQVGLRDCVACDGTGDRR